jgi:hypothetical protein
MNKNEEKSSTIRLEGEYRGESVKIVADPPKAHGLTPEQIQEALAEFSQSEDNMDPAVLEDYVEMLKSVTFIPECCATCGITNYGGANLSKCGRCLLILYCSRDCQKKHWSIHKGECQPRNVPAGTATVTIKDRRKTTHTRERK